VGLGSIDRDVQNSAVASTAAATPLEAPKLIVAAHARPAATRLPDARPVLRLTAPPAAITHETTVYERFFKPVIDRALALVLLIVLSPILLVVSAMVAKSLGRPIVLRQRRVGRNGEPFVLHKFRTMHPDRRSPGREYEGDDRRITHKHPDDPRLTKVGQTLRKWSLDELPQLWDVVLGTLSLVGPRPELESIVARYEPWQHARHAVKPGLTGLWQVKARGDGEMHEHTDLDIEYVQKVTLRGDLKIMILTLPAILTRKGY
jgi:lipopolysaccharide/colanic/teichoic acid biosynthesis glycosyltransferase